VSGVPFVAAVSGAAGIGAAAGMAVMLPMEAGVPVPLPSDLVMLAVGARVGAGDVPLWVAIVAFEAIAVVGTVALLLIVRGPGHALVARVGPRLGLTESRLARAGVFLERRGSLGLVIGRATPGLRTLTVAAAGGTGMSVRRALPPLVIGSSIFLQLHLFLGYFLGSAARHALRAATGPAIVVAAALLAGAVAFWLVRRGRQAGTRGLLEAACPACVALAFLSEEPAGLHGLVEPGAH
jgi:membrane protein DedA with SNARE-associated domain